MRRIAVLVLSSLLLLSAFSLWSQTTSARLDGTVQDASGAVIPNAKVTAVNVKTQATSETTTGPQGLFVLPALQPGMYTLTVEASGFRKAVRTDIELNVGATFSETVQMEVGAVTETVTIAANVERVQTTESHVGRSVTMRDIDVLPQLARTPITLAVYQPGVQINAGNDSFSVVNGLRQGSNNSKLDGIDINDAVVPRMGLSLTANNTDSIGEFRVITAAGKAEYGRSAGAQIELITRSGTNEWHGNLFNYLRNDKLHANPFFSNSSGVKRPKFIQNQYGGSLGAPIIKDKTFIFGNFQGRRVKQEIVRNRTVLSPEAKSGIFRWRSPGSTAIQQFNIVANDPRAKGIDPKVNDLLKLLPAGNNTDVGDGLNTVGFRFNTGNNNLEDQFTIRADHNLTSAHRIFYRHSWQRNDFIDSLNNADSPFPGGVNGTQGGRRWGFAGGSDWTLASWLVNEFRYGHQSASVSFNRPQRLQGPAILPNLFTNPILPNFAQGRNSPVDDWTDNLTIIKGQHTFKTGTNIRWTTQNGFNDAGIYPNISLTTANGNNVPTTIGPAGGAVIASADRTRFENLYNTLLGRVNQVTQTFYSDLSKFQAGGTPRVRNFKFREYGFFFQDDWRVRPNLTLNLGMRWEFSGVPFEQDGLQGTLDKSAQINSVSQIDNFTIQRSSNWYNNDWNNFAPRIGFAWNPKGDGKMAIRGAYGVFYDRIIGATSSLVDGNTPGFSQAVPVFPNSGGTDIRVSDNPALPAQPPAPVLTLPATRSTSVVVFQPDLRTGYVQQISLNVQREVLRNTIVDVGYVGTYGIKLFSDVNLDQQKVFQSDFFNSFVQLQQLRANTPATNTLVRIFGTAAAAVSAISATSLDQGLVGSAATTVDRNNFSRYANAGVSQFYLRNFPQFNQLIQGNNDGRSYYNSLQVSVRRSAGAFRGNLNYTYSKSTDNVSVDGNGFTNPIDNFNFGLNKGRGNNDIPHSFNFSSIYTLPIGKGQRWGANLPKALDLIIGGWDLGTTGIWQSGRVYTASSGRVTGPNAGINSWANYTGDRNIGQVERKGNGVFFLEPAQTGAFSFPTAGQIGNSGRNAFRGPRYFAVDLSVVKRFKITERHAISFRAEAYNLFNNANFAGMGTSLATPTTFGKFSTTAGTPRIMQLALRYDF